MSEKRGFLRFLILVLSPIILIVLGGAIVAFGFQNDWMWLFWTGLVVAGAGLLWGIVLLLIHGPVDLFL